MRVKGLCPITSPDDLWGGASHFRLFRLMEANYLLSGMEDSMKAIKQRVDNWLFLVLLVLVCAGCQASVLHHETPGLAVVSAFNPPYSIQTPLPESMKGYEVYSWVDGDTRSFTLITGTNRTKDSHEITSAENIVTIDGWVKVSVPDVEALKVLLSRLPGGETILFMGGSDIGPAPVEGINITLPPRSILDSLEEYCTDIGLKLIVFD